MMHNFGYGYGHWIGPVICLLLLLGSLVLALVPWLACARRNFPQSLRPCGHWSFLCPSWAPWPTLSSYRMNQKKRNTQRASVGGSFFLSTSWIYLVPPYNKHKHPRGMIHHRVTKHSASYPLPVS